MYYGNFLLSLFAVCYLKINITSLPLLEFLQQTMYELLQQRLFIVLATVVFISYYRQVNPESKSEN